MALIESRMVEANRTLQIFSKRNTQTDMKLRTLTMLSVGAPYRTLRQIAAQINTKRQALQEAYFNLQDRQADIEDIERYGDRASKKELIWVERLRCEAGMIGANMEAALKEIGALTAAYEEIRESKGIAERWDEADMEVDEIMHNLKSAFRNGIRDFIATGRMGHGTQEWLEQFGVSPIEGHREVAGFIDSGKTDYESMMEFLAEMAAKYAENYKKVMNTLGLKTLIDADWLYKEER
jgi:phosphoglycolate phosphatase-like HAD superfamily hydrolase